MSVTTTNELFTDTEDRMKKTLESLGRDFRTIRTGRATPALIERITVDAYGQEMPINQLASVNVPEARMLVIQPWDKSQIGAIEKAIMKSDLGITPTNDGQVIRLAFPPLTEDRRKELVKVIKKKAEEARVSMRNIRRDALEHLKGLELPEDQEKRAQDQVQKLTDRYIEEISKSLDVKEKEIMEV
ncbi:MAG: ribosome recycling factor [Candidatus Eremiobacterota bacterium]